MEATLFAYALYLLDDVEAAPHGRLLERTRERRPPIHDVVDATAWWGCFAKERTSTARWAPHKAAPDVIL